MRVKELIELLQRCPQDCIVMYDAKIGYQQAEEPEELCFGVDDVMVGTGTLRGFVYLTEEEVGESE